MLPAPSLRVRHRARLTNESPSSLSIWGITVTVGRQAQGGRKASPERLIIAQHCSHSGAKIRAGFLEDMKWAMKN